MRKYEGLMTEAEERFYSTLDNMSYEEINELMKTHSTLLMENSVKLNFVDMGFDEFLDKYDLVDMTSFFVSHGLKLPDDESVK